MTDHLREVPIPEATRQALALMREQRDKALTAATHYREALEKIQNMNWMAYQEPYSKGVAHRALLYDSGISWERRTWRDRIAARIQTWRAR